MFAEWDLISVFRGRSLKVSPYCLLILAMNQNRLALDREQTVEGVVLIHQHVSGRRSHEHLYSHHIFR